MTQYAVIAGTLLVFAALLSMADYKQVRARLRERLVAMTLFFGGIALAILVIRATAPKTPSTASVNGTYSNPCCSPIILSNGLLISGELRVPFKLRVEKWGNDAELKTGIRVRDGKIIPSSNSGSDVILFDQSWRKFTVCRSRCGPANEFEFTRA